MAWCYNEGIINLDWRNIYLMNKNIITSVLLVGVLVIGFALIKTSSRLQQAAVVGGGYLRSSSHRC